MRAICHGSSAFLRATNGSQEKFVVLRRWGVPKFSKSYKNGKTRTKHKGMHLLTPCKDEHNTTFHGWSCCYSSSSNFCFLSILLTCIAKCRNVSLLILRRSCVRMCPNKLKALSTCLSDCPLQTVCGTPGCLLVPLGLCCPLLSGFNSRHHKTK